VSRRVVAPTSVEIPGPVGLLEGLVEAPEERTPTLALICHPHPLHGGAMTNKVVHTLARTFYRLGSTVVRFNFRGVGSSAGVHSHGEGERDDALAAAHWALARQPESRLLLAGFSFGAGIAAAVATQLEPMLLVTVALPVARLSADLALPACPWLIVQGAEDELVSTSEVERWRAQRAPAARLAVIEGASHFFHGKLTALADEVEAFARAEALRADAAAQ
jgi:uncharacterized protein